MEAMQLTVPAQMRLYEKSYFHISSATLSQLGASGVLDGGPWTSLGASDGEEQVVPALARALLRDRLRRLEREAGSMRLRPEYAERPSYMPQTSLDNDYDISFSTCVVVKSITRRAG